MTDSRTSEPTDAAGSGLVSFLVESVASLLRRRLILPALLLAVLLTSTNIVLARWFPAEGEASSWQFAAAALDRSAGLFVLGVAILRALNDSPRPLWRPDGAFWLYGVSLVAGFGIAIAAAALLGSREDAWSELVTGLIVIVASAPLAAWFTAIAVERPLAWRPGPWLSRFRSWLPHLIFWSVLILLPLGQIHAAAALRLIEGGPWFWAVALVDGPLSVLLALIGLALASTAYRHVARG